LDVRLIYRGDYAEWTRQSFQSMSAREIKKAMLVLYEKRYEGVSLSKTPITKDFPEDNRFEITAEYVLPKPLTHKENKYVFEYESRIIEGTLAIPEKSFAIFRLSCPLNLIVRVITCS